MQMSLFGGTFARLSEDGASPRRDADDAERYREPKKSLFAFEASGFDVRAGITVRGGDREGRERLCRYRARPCVSLARMAIPDDRRVAYRLKKPRRNGATHLVLAPLAFMAKFASLVPPPRYPLVRLAGVFAPNCAAYPPAYLVHSASRGSRSGGSIPAAGGRAGSARS